MCFELPRLSYEKENGDYGFNFLQNNTFLSFQNVQTFLGGPSSLVLKGYLGLSSSDVVESGTDHPPPYSAEAKNV
jgi:hypothetical protein